MDANKKKMPKLDEKITCEGNKNIINSKRKWKWSIFIAVICLIMAISWPLIERHFSSSMPNCPSAIKRLVTYFQRDHPAKDRVDAENLKIYTLEELKKYVALQTNERMRCANAYANISIDMMDPTHLRQSFLP